MNKSNKALELLKLAYGIIGNSELASENADWLRETEEIIFAPENIEALGRDSVEGSSV